jgi:hypothetical protein
VACQRSEHGLWRCVPEGGTYGLAAGSSVEGPEGNNRLAGRIDLEEGRRIAAGRSLVRHRTAVACCQRVVGVGWTLMRS